jgi:hypothetical protein
MSRLKALAKFLELDSGDKACISTSAYDPCVLQFDGAKYLVLTDEEAEQRFDEAIRDFIEDCFESTLFELMEIPKNIRDYFDEERFIHDVKANGRGPYLSSDGRENKVLLDDKYYFIYYRVEL